MPKLLQSTTFITTGLFLYFLTTAHSTTFPTDIAALRAFKSSVDPTSIPASSCLATWNFSSTDPCSVPRVTHFTCAVTCSNNRVVQLTLDSQNYAGTLTPLISKLTQLITLDLSDNKFHGPIPNSLASLPNLRNLILRVNSFSGWVPPSVNSLKSLTTLDLSRNELTGPLPAMDSMMGLTRLDLSYNKLTGSIPKLPPNLNELAVKSNSLSGSLSEASFTGLTRLMVAELAENSFVGKLDTWLFLLPSLQQIDLANNSFTDINVSKPAAAADSSVLVAVNLSFNKIGGFLPASFGEFPMLRSLAVSGNKLRGPIPAEYGEKGSSLRRLFLDGNFLNGSPPVGFFGGGEAAVSGSLGDNCLKSCPVSSGLCVKLQKPVSVCQQAYGKGWKPES